MNTFNIFLGTTANYSELVSVWKKSVLATHDFLKKEHFEQIESDMKSTYLPSVDELWIAHTDGVVSGFCGNNDASVEMLFIHPQYMRKGIGQALLKHVKKLHGLLSVDVNEQNAQALSFYLANGFEIIGRSPMDNAGHAYPLLHLRQMK